MIRFIIEALKHTGKYDKSEAINIAKGKYQKKSIWQRIKR